MGKYQGFINELKKDNFGGFNAIEYADGGFEPYISFQALLKWVSEYPNLYSNEEEIVSIDYLSDKPFFTYSTSISCDLSKCYVRNKYLGTTQGTFQTAPPFKDIDTFKDSNYSSLNTTLEEEAEVEEYPSIYPQVGNINYIYISVSFLTNLILKESDNKDNKVSVSTFLQKVCDGVNKSLGSINDFQVITDVDGIKETLTIIDYQQKRIKGLPDIEKKDSREITTIRAQGLGSMLTKIQAQSSITPEIASMIAIGAQAQSQIVGEEATSFSRLSRGLTDKVYPTKVQSMTEKALKKEEKRKKAIEKKFNQAISTYSKFIANQKPIQGKSFSPVELKSTDKANLSNVATELYKSCLAMFTDTKQTSTAFIPVKLNLSMYGLGGLKIYQRFKLSNDVLPLSYKGEYEFITLGIDHTVDTSRWETNISAVISLKDELLKKEGADEPFSIKLKEIEPTPEPPSTNPGPAATSPTGPDFIPGDTDYSPILNPPPRKGIYAVDSPLVKSLKGKKLKNANLKVTDSTVLVPIVGGDRNFKTRYGGYLLNPIAAAAWGKAYQELLNKGITLQVYSAYRDIQHQRAISKKSPKGAAKPGTSKHGWGTALDISPFNRMAKYVNGRKSTPAGNLDGRKTQFYFKVGTVMAKHGWYNPWSIADNTGSVDELWHWEYWGPVK